MDEWSWPCTTDSKVVLDYFFSHRGLLVIYHYLLSYTGTSLPELLSDTVLVCFFATLKFLFLVFFYFIYSFGFGYETTQ